MIFLKTRNNGQGVGHSHPEGIGGWRGAITDFTNSRQALKKVRLSRHCSDRLTGKFKVVEDQSTGNGRCELTEPNWMQPILFGSTSHVSSTS